MARRLVPIVLAIATVAPACAARRTSVRPPPAVHAPPPAHTIVPMPVAVAIDEAAPPFLLAPTTPVLVSADDERLMRIGQTLAEFIAKPPTDSGPRAAVVSGDIPRGAIVLTLTSTPNSGDEGYELTIAADRITIGASSHAGVFYGVQTLRHLLPPSFEFRGLRLDPAKPIALRAARVVDRPRFAWRGAMLDVARHFLMPDEVKRYIDLLALYKMNRLHLHLADDQGWRIEIRSWPNLTAHGGSTQVGGGRGGYYSQAQYQDLVAYASERFITIVPEIDMPGHTNAALASYAELNCDGRAPPLFTGTRVGFSALCVDREVTYTFIDQMVQEIAALTPGPYFHVGGDEVQTLTPEQYARFVTRVQAIVERHGKQMIGWDEIAAADLHTTTLVQHWRPTASPAAALSKGVRLIMSIGSRMYLDMKYDARTPIGLNWAGYIEARDAYDWDPAAMIGGAPESAMAGVEAPLWTETITSIHDAEFLAFPRLAEIAEVGWSAAAGRRWEEFRGRLGAQAARWSALGVNFYRSPQVPWTP